MSDELGRGDFLDAATVLRKNRMVLETRKKEIDSELTIFKGAEDALIALGEADRIRGEVEAKIQAARTALAEIEATVARSRKAARESIDGFNAEVKTARETTQAALDAEERRRREVSARTKALDESVKEAENVAADRLADLTAQIAAKEVALASLRDTIASLAKL